MIVDWIYRLQWLIVLGVHSIRFIENSLFRKSWFLFHVTHTSILHGVSLTYVERIEHQFSLFFVLCVLLMLRRIPCYLFFGILSLHFNKFLLYIKQRSIQVSMYHMQDIQFISSGWVYLHLFQTNCPLNQGRKIISMSPQKRKSTVLMCVW